MTIELNAEQEKIVEEAVRQGRFQSVEEAVDQAIHSIAPKAGKRQPGKPSLVELFENSPFRGLDLRIERAQDTGRPIDL